MSNVYLIDGSLVNDRPDWTNPPATSATTAARQESFPGSGVTFTMTSPQRGVRIVIEGWHEGTGSADLRDQVAQADGLRFDAQTHTVKILDTTYNDCQLIELRVLGKPLGFRWGNKTVRQRVRYVWQQLSAGGAS